MANFKVDILIKTIDDLQKEKSKNEQILAKECAKRRKLEQTVESLISSLSQASDRNTKMKAEFKLEEQGQEQTQRQIDRLEEINLSIRQRIVTLNHQLKEIKDMRQQEQERFEQNMTKLIDQFRSGWQCLEDEKNSEVETNYDDEIMCVQERKEMRKKKLESLMAELAAVQISEPTMVGGIPEHVWKTTKSLFKKENQVSKASLVETQKELNLEPLENELTNLKNINAN